MVHQNIIFQFSHIDGHEIPVRLIIFLLISKFPLSDDKKMRQHSTLSFPFLIFCRISYGHSNDDV